MANAHFPRTDAPDSGAAPSSAHACPGCGRSIDALRAGHVAIMAGRFRYFCGPECKLGYLEAAGRLHEEEAPTASPPEVAYRNGRSPAIVTPPPPSARSEEERPPSRRSAAPASPTAAPVAATPPVLPARPARLRLHAVVGAVGIACGALTPAMGLLGGVADVARLPLAAVALAALALRLRRTPPDPADPSRVLAFGPPAVAAAAALWGHLERDPMAPAMASLVGLASAVAIASELLVARARVRVNAARERVHRALDVPVRAIRGSEVIELPASSVRPGEQVVVDAGDVIGVDAIVLAGEARVVPWVDAPVEVVRREGDPVVAGAKVLSSRLRLTTTWSGPDRAWVKLSSAPLARIDVAAPTARALRVTVERGAPIAAALVGVGAFAANATPVEVLASMSAGAIAFSAHALASIVGLHFARAHVEALASGITYKDARAFERAASANVAVLSARGTVLMGEPEIVAIEPIGPRASDPGVSMAETAADAVGQLLALAAGAETASTHPFAAAILRAARARGVRADHVRNPTVRAGLGVTAVASNGERLVVGGRAMMLEEKIGVAVADARVTELEAEGRSVLLVALAGRLVGLIALQDGLRVGARAAVQRLLDARIEPVLLSGEARETCDTLGRALDIEHVRPEVLPADRGAEVRALGEGGSIVAVVGHPVGDDPALGAADVAVAMGSAGSTPGEWAVGLASDDVRDAAFALALPHWTRARVRVAIALGGAPGLVALLAIGFGVAPVEVAPLAALVGAVAVAAHARESATRD
ncbi:MAG TPA: HAD family hydrolase [Polyangiaceae bacterium]|nr:HAD family hydrolase [Polyangiaceae bacterium]